VISWRFDTKTRGEQLHCSRVLRDGLGRTPAVSSAEVLISGCRFSRALGRCRRRRRALQKQGHSLAGVLYTQVPARSSSAVTTRPTPPPPTVSCPQTATTVYDNTGLLDEDFGASRNPVQPLRGELVANNITERSRTFVNFNEASNR